MAWSRSPSVTPGSIPWDLLREEERARQEIHKEVPGEDSIVDFEWNNPSTSGWEVRYLVLIGLAMCVTSLSRLEVELASTLVNLAVNISRPWDIRLNSLLPARSVSQDIEADTNGPVDILPVPTFTQGLPQLDIS
jgi:hypothetical protein